MKQGCGLLIRMPHQKLILHVVPNFTLAEYIYHLSISYVYRFGLDIPLRQRLKTDILMGEICG